MAALAENAVRRHARRRIAEVFGVAGRGLLDDLCKGRLAIRTAGQYCDHMVHGSRVNPARVADILGLDIAVEAPGARRR